MLSKVFGFVGIESYDIVFALGCVASSLGRKVLVVDNSRDGAFACIVPFGVGKDCTVNYYDIDVARDTLLHSIDYDDEYDYVITYLGDNITCRDISACDEVYLVTDYQKHNILRLSQLELQDEQCRYLIYRERVTARVDLRFIQEKLSPLSITDETSYLVSESQADYDNMVMLQYNNVLRKFFISESVGSFIIDVLNVDFSERDIRAAIKTVNRRK